jgi:lipoate-protein ligase A
VTPPWTFEHSVGDAVEFHAREPAPVRAAWWFEVERPTLVLGSTQPIEAVNQRVADALGVEVLRRRSGGGAVLLVPGEFVWLDVVVPRGDLLWSDDVGAAMHWIGDVWADALAGLGVQSGVHRGALVTTPWSKQVCFAGVGPGEVLAHGRKIVGIAQRRTRSWARLQTMCHLRWRPELVAALVAAPRPGALELASCVATVEATAADVAAAVDAALGDR